MATDDQHNPALDTPQEKLAEGSPPDKPAPVDDYAEFSRIFDELSADPKPALKDTTTAPPALEDAAKAKEVTEPPPEKSAQADAPAAVEGTEGEPAPAKVGEPEHDPAHPAEPAVEDWEKKYNEYKAETDAWRATVDKAEKPAAEKPPEKAAPAPELYDADEKAFLDQYGKDWPEVIKGEQLRRRAEYRQVATHIFAEINRVYGPVLERAVATADQVADNTLLGTVREAHPDYNLKMYEDLTAWATDLKGFKGKLAREVIASGEPGDVVDLIADFKRETGRSKPAAVVTPPAPAAKTPLSDAAKKAAKALGVVDTKRSAVVQAADPHDFDAAWKEANAK